MSACAAFAPPRAMRVASALEVTVKMVQRQRRLRRVAVVRARYRHCSARWQVECERVRVLRVLSARHVFSAQVQRMLREKRGVQSVFYKRAY